jgi:hypothetical protein
MAADPPPPIKRKKTEGDTLWIKDDTLDSSTTEEEKPTIRVPTPTSDETYEEEEEEETEEDGEEEDEPEESRKDDFLDYLMHKYSKAGPSTRSQNKKSACEKLPMHLSKVEIDYYNNQPAERKSSLRALMTKMTELSMTEGDGPHNFRVLELQVSDYI